MIMREIIERISDWKFIWYGCMYQICIFEVRDLISVLQFDQLVEQFFIIKKFFMCLLVYICINLNI